MNVSTKDVARRYANALISCNSRCLIDVPTRIGQTCSMLLDHIYTNDLTKPVSSGVLTNFDLSDHYSIFVIISKKTCHKNRQGVDYKIRDMTQFDLDKFLECLDNKLSSLFETSLIPINELFELFLATFVEIVDQFAPERKATRKEKRLRLKPWISRGLLKSIQTKNRLFKQLQKKREDSVLKNKYKIYRNILNRALKWAKSNHHHSVLEEHKGDYKNVGNRK